MENYCNYLNINTTIYRSLFSNYYHYFKPDIEPLLTIDWTINIILLCILDNNPKANDILLSKIINFTEKYFSVTWSHSDEIFVFLFIFIFIFRNLINIHISEDL